MKGVVIIICLIIGVIGIVCAIICLMCENGTSKINASICLIIATINILYGANTLLK